MKSHQLNFFFIYLLILNILVSCGDDSEEPSPAQSPIVGIWRAESTSFTIDGVEFRDYLRTLYAGLGIPISDTELDAIIEETAADAEFLVSEVEFESGGNFRITNADNSEQSGTWSISGDTLTLDEGDESSTFTIQRLTSSELHLLSQLDEENNPGLQGFEDSEVEAVFTFTR